MQSYPNTKFTFANFTSGACCAGGDCYDRWMFRIESYEVQWWSLGAHPGSNPYHSEWTWMRTRKMFHGPDEAYVREFQVRWESSGRRSCCLDKDFPKTPH